MMGICGSRCSISSLLISQRSGMILADVSVDRLVLLTVAVVVDAGGEGYNRCSKKKKKSLP
jgi:hypothetical protein